MSIGNRLQSCLPHGALTHPLVRHGVWSFFSSFLSWPHQQWDTEDAETEVPFCCCWEPRADKLYPFKAWSRSEYSQACSIHCREFDPCLHFYLLGPFTFFFWSVITILIKITSVHLEDIDFPVRHRVCTSCSVIPTSQRSMLKDVFPWYPDSCYDWAVHTE